jgi:chromosome segregation ATPase
MIEMSSEFMGKKLNVFLLLIIIFILLGMLGVSVYYQNTLKNKKNEIESTSGKLSVCEQNVTSMSDILFNTMKSLNSTETDIRKYDTLYEQKAAELEKKKTELSNTQADLTRMTVLQETYKKQIDVYSGQVINLNKNITSLISQVTSLNREVDRLNDRVDCLRNTVDGEERIACMT